MPISITMNDLLTIGFLVFLEGVLSVDNALVLALIVRPLPEKLQKRALTYGIAGAIFFRILAISTAVYIMHLEWVKFAGGAYLVYIPIKYLWDRRSGSQADAEKRHSQIRSFWFTVLIVEISDIMFAIDSILTAVALTQKLWIVLTGGLLGLIAVRIAAGFFIKILARYPRFEPTAYIMVFLVGLKLLMEGIVAKLNFTGIDFHDPKDISFWAFWGAMIMTILYGFLPQKNKSAKQHDAQK